MCLVTDFSRKPRPPISQTDCIDSCLFVAYTSFTECVGKCTLPWKHVQVGMQHGMCRSCALVWLLNNPLQTGSLSLCPNHCYSIFYLTGGHVVCKVQSATADFTLPVSSPCLHSFHHEYISLHLQVSKLREYEFWLVLLKRVVFDN